MLFNLLTSIPELIIYFIQSHVSNSLFDHDWLDRGVCSIRNCNMLMHAKQPHNNIIYVIEVRAWIGVLCVTPLVNAF